MTKDVLITISGLQFDIDQNEALEVVSVGEYYFRNGKHYIIYDEVVPCEDGSNEITKNTIKISENQISIMKKGSSNVQMVFEVDKKNLTYYYTPFGELMIGLFTTSMNVTKKEDSLRVNLEYALDINYSHVSDCSIRIEIESK